MTSVPQSGLSQVELLAALRRVHQETRAAVLEACQQRSLEELVGEAVAAEGDTVYAVDRIAEETYLSAMEREVAQHTPVIVIGEGLPGGRVVLPPGASEADAPWQIIVDPIDGTRSFMFQKRSAWIVTGAAPQRGSAARLSDIQVAVQSELPLLKQCLCDEFCAIRGQGVASWRTDLRSDSQEAGQLALKPTTTSEIAHGYLTVCSFFAGGRDVLGGIADELSRRLLAPAASAEARLFEDQYCSTAGQLAGLLTGQDRVVVDIRPLLEPLLEARGEAMPHCCHPYDLSALLVAQEAGVIVTAPDGSPLDAPLDTETNVGWVGYANAALRRTVEPVLHQVLHDRLL